MKKVFLIIFYLVVFGCVTYNKTPEKASNGRADTQGQFMVERYYGLIGIKNGNAFEVFEPGHGGGGLLKFNRDGSFEASSGVNNGFGKYSYKSATAEFSPLVIDLVGVTRMAGETAQANAFDALFFKNLSQCKLVKIEGNVIKLADAQKNELLWFYVKR